MVNLVTQNMSRVCSKVNCMHNYFTSMLNSLCNVLSFKNKASMVPLLINQYKLNDLFPGVEKCIAKKIKFEQDYGMMLDVELEALCRVVSFIQPRHVFEIGTFLGGTTLNLAANSTAKVHTLDLGQHEASSRKGRNDYNPMSDVYPIEPGIRFKDSSYEDRIIQHIGDSMHFDFSKFHKQIDFVFVDGCHKYEYILSDSKNALDMVSENGVIAWHDYADYEPGVVQALHELKSQIPLKHLEGTSLVFYSRA